MLSCVNHSSSGVLLLGGQTSDEDSTKELKTGEIFPSQARVQNTICSIPDLAQGRHDHTLSILSPSGSFVVCGGSGEEYSEPSNNSTTNATARTTKVLLDTCLNLTSYGAADASWVNGTKMRFAFDYAIPMIIDFQKDSCSRAKRAGHIAWTPPSLNNTVVFLGGNEGNEANWDAEIWPGERTRT